MPIRRAEQADLTGWVDLRARLWPDTSRDAHWVEAAALLAHSPRQFIVFLDIGHDARPRAFAEAALRHDHVNGCDTSPVAFLEGIYVRPDVQGAGIGRALLDAVQGWARDRGCAELASDADIDNTASHAFHRAVGLHEAQRVVFFRKML